MTKLFKAFVFAFIQAGFIATLIGLVWGFISLMSIVLAAFSPITQVLICIFVFSLTALTIVNFINLED